MIGGDGQWSVVLFCYLLPFFVRGSRECDRSDFDIVISPITRLIDEKKRPKQVR